MVLVWLTLLGNKAEIGGYDRGDFVLYYLLITVGWYVVGGTFSYQLGGAIRRGEINKTLLKPYNIVIGEAVSEQAWKLTSLIIVAPAIALVSYLMRDYLSWRLPVEQIPQLVVVVILAALMYALTQAIIGILAFWVTEVWPFAEALEITLELFGGLFAPLALLPDVVQRVSLFLPFRYIFYEPVNMLLGNQSDPLAIIWRQGVFVVILGGMYKLIWRAGIRKYEGLGG